MAGGTSVHVVFWGTRPLTHDISCICAAYGAGQFATGSRSGQICIWDLERAADGLRVRAAESLWPHLLASLRHGFSFTAMPPFTPAGYTANALLHVGQGWDPLSVPREAAQERRPPKAGLARRERVSGALRVWTTGGGGVAWRGVVTYLLKATSPCSECGSCA